MIKIGTHVKTLIEKKFKEGDKEIVIPKGSEGLVAEVNNNSGKDWAWVEIWGDGAPEGAFGVYDYLLTELEITD